MKRIVITCILFVGVFSAQAKKVIDFSKEEKALVTIYNKITRFATEEENLKNNEAFISLLDSVLHIPTSFNYPFSELKLGNVYSPDYSLRIISWNMIHDDGTYESFGYVQLNPEGKRDFAVYKLVDKSNTIKAPSLKVLTPEEWYGASYYQIVQTKKKGAPIYTLIGWNPHNLYTQQKVIDVLFIKKGVLQFGYPLLEIKGKGSQRRVIFEYSSKSAMMLRYEKKKKMIVFDHLSPSAERYTGIYEFYGPDFSIDGYKYKNGKWRYENDIDIRNDRPKLKDYFIDKKDWKLRYKNGLDEKDRKPHFRTYVINSIRIPFIYNLFRGNNQGN